MDPCVLFFVAIGDAGGKTIYRLQAEVVPKILPELMNGSDRDRAKRALDAMLKMTKLDVAKIREAADGVPA